MSAAPRESLGSSSPELLKLARTLGADVGELDFLANVPPEALRQLRQQISDSMFAMHKHQFHKLAALSGSVPGPVAAKVTEGAMSPLVSARTAEVLSPDRAVEMMKRLSADYVTEIATRLDAYRSRELLANLPAEQVADIAESLAGRGEWVVMGALMSYVSDEALAASVARLTPEQLLRIGYVVDEPLRITHVMDALDDARVTALFEATVAHDLWAETDTVVAALRADQVDRVGKLLDNSTAAIIAAYAAARSRGDLTAI